jgi:uncharacterized protein (UPF0333 family)
MSDNPTIIKESSSGAGWFIGVVLLIAIIAGVFAFSQYNASNSVKNNAIANAADNVGAAAKKAGDAVPSGN